MKKNVRWRMCKQSAARDLNEKTEMFRVLNTTLARAERLSHILFHC
jgi:hypothetical protein